MKVVLLTILFVSTGFSFRLKGPLQKQRLSRQSTHLNDIHHLVSSLTPIVLSSFFDEPPPIDPQVANEAFDQGVRSFTNQITGRVIGTIVGNLAAAVFFKFISDNVLSKFNQKEEQPAGQRNVVEKVVETPKFIVPEIPTEAYLKLILCILIDLTGDASFLLPGIGEVEDVAWAPISAFLLKSIFDSNLIGTLEFAKEILPFSDIVPLATLCWSLQYVFPDSPLARTLKLDGGLQAQASEAPPAVSKKEKEMPKDYIEMPTEAEPTKK